MTTSAALCVCVCVHVHVVMCLPNWRFNNKTLPSNGSPLHVEVVVVVVGFVFISVRVPPAPPFLRTFVVVLVCVCPGLRIYLCDCGGAWVCLRDCVKKGINEPIEIISFRGWVLLFLFLLLQLA